jgi:hypothetical protein
MASILTKAADAVCSELNTKLAGWGYLTTQAERKNLARFALEESNTLRVTVVPAEAPVETAARLGLLRWSPNVDIILHKRIGNDQDAEDTLLEFAETVAAHFLGSFSNEYHKVMAVESGIVPSTKEMEDKGLFAVAVRLTLQAHSSGESE